MNVRHLEERDYDPIIAVLDDWFGGRPLAKLLPRIFFIHFGQRVLASRGTAKSSLFWQASSPRLMRTTHTSTLLDGGTP